MPKVTYACVDCGKKRTASPKCFSKPQEEYRCQKCAARKNRVGMNSKITKTCVDCGKERTGYPSEFKKLKREEYRCRGCNNKKYAVKDDTKIVTYKCIDCGKEKTAYQSWFMKPREEYRCQKCNRKLKRISKVTYTCIDCGKERTAYTWEFNKLPEEYRCKPCTHKITILSPTWIENNKLGAIKRMEDPEWKSSQMKGTEIRSQNPEWQKMMSDRNKRLCHDPTWIENQRRGARDSSNKPEWKENILISTSGQGFWYGHPILHDTPIIYCELWKDVNPRVHAFFDNKCCVCNTPETTRSHVGHHVFYVKEACCWHNDGGEYYTNLNVKTHRKDEYYIGDNPNYFVILCPSCHGKTNGSFENRKKWADYFKNMIDEDYNGKCYLTKEEYEIYKNIK